MRNPIGGLAALIILIAVLVIGMGSVFTVGQTQQALVLRFGEPISGRALVTTPGLHFKIPFIETVTLLDNRILDLETSKQEVLASDNNRIEVDAFLRYRIVDALRFYQTVGTIQRANNQLGSVLSSALRRVLGEATMLQIVREGRSSLMVSIRDLVNTEASRLGAEVIDVRIRRADLPRQISERIYNRMQTERSREAAEFRAQGSEQAQKIRARADRDVVVLRAEAQRQADQVRGEGDAERNRIFAEAYNQDPKFFSFYRSMQAYETGLKGGDTRLIISPNSEFFRFFGQSSGIRPPAANANGAPEAPAGSPQAQVNQGAARVQ
ncbi:MAG: protease modulator HflC [Beijerinckiaceae bacterium]|jgi:modulator of FtsH protease HflC|nr:protease modulator HflC [Beijerinckiaceae bacterium]MDO9439621.1 protease modulator HflC [Beijerinckiaceae bacterium]